MFDKINEFSKTFVVLGAVLYFFGFISVNSYLSRFGMVSFDVVNSRFVFAGFFSVLSVGLAVLLAWSMAKEVPLRELFNVNKYPFWRRIFRYLLILFYINSVNLVLTGILSLGKPSVRLDNSVLKYSHLFGSHDSIGKFLEGNYLWLTGGLGYSVKIVLNILFYLAVIWLIIFSLGWLFGKYGKQKVPKAVEQAKEATKKEIVPYVPGDKDYFYFIVDLGFIFFFIAMGFYCCKRLLTHLVDFSTFQEGFELTPNILFVWFYPTVAILYLFLNTKIKRLPFATSQELFNMSNLFDNSELIRQYLIPVAAALITFGQVVFPRIPFAIGGGEPRQVVIKMHEGKDLEKGNVFLLGESSQYVFLVNVGKKESLAYQVSKSEIDTIQTVYQRK